MGRNSNAWIIIDDNAVDTYRDIWGQELTEKKLRLILVKNGFDLRYHIEITSEYDGKHQSMYVQNAEIIAAGSAAKRARLVG